MKFAGLLYFLLLPLVSFAAFPQLPHPYKSVNWSNYDEWPEKLIIQGNTYLIQVGGGSCAVFSAPEGTKPPKEKIQKWGTYSAYYQTEVRSSKSYLYDVYGPEITWDSQHTIIRRNFYNAKGAFYSYDKNGKPFYKEWSLENGHSRGYLNEYGRLALEDRTTITPDKKYIHTILRYRKPCSETEFKFTKELLMEKFELYEHPQSQR